MQTATCAKSQANLGFSVVLFRKKGVRQNFPNAPIAPRAEFCD